MSSARACSQSCRADNHLDEKSAFRPCGRDVVEFFTSTVRVFSVKLNGLFYKGECQENTSPTTGRRSSLTSSPSALGDTFCCDTDLTSSPFGMAFCDATTPIGLRNLASVPVVRCQPWFYLRLVAYGFIGLSEGA